MLVLNKRRKLLLKIEDVYFAEDYRNYATDADIVLFYQSSLCKPGSKEYHTLHIDLTKDEGIIFSDFDRRTRNDILKAQKTDNFKTFIKSAPSDDEVNTFCNFYDGFAQNKGIDRCDRNLVMLLKNENALSLSDVTGGENRTLCSHAYFYDRKRVRALYSCSWYRTSEDRSYRNMIARANRYLHWTDIKHFKEKGFLLYDFGGLALNGKNSDLNRVDEFKKGFGGTIVTEYHFYHARNLPGNLVLAIWGRKNANL